MVERLSGLVLQDRAAARAPSDAFLSVLLA
jgi:hypothetical protein